jgi:hypothetical protein
MVLNVAFIVHILSNVPISVVADVNVNEGAVRDTTFIKSNSATADEMLLTESVDILKFEG